MAEITSEPAYRKAISVISISTKDCFGSTQPRNDKQGWPTLRHNRYSVAVIPNEERDLEHQASIQYRESCYSNLLTEEDGENT